VKKKTPEQIQFERDFVLAAGMSGDTKTVRHIWQVLAGSAPFIITHNTRHFRSADVLGIRAVTPDQFLRILSAP
jgi:hypothetical protein